MEEQQSQRPCADCPYHTQEKQLELQVKQWGEKFREVILKCLLFSLAGLLAIAVLGFTYTSITGNDVKLPHYSETILSLLQQIFTTLADLLQ